MEEAPIPKVNKPPEFAEDLKDFSFDISKEEKIVDKINDRKFDQKLDKVYRIQLPHIRDDDVLKYKNMTIED